jgi:hypothetical protein
MKSGESGDSKKAVNKYLKKFSLPGSWGSWGDQDAVIACVERVVAEYFAGFMDQPFVEGFNASGICGGWQSCQTV